MKRFLWIAVACLALLSSTSAHAELSAPEQVVDRYCKADMGGANLSSDARIKSGIESDLIIYEGATSAWDKSVLIKGYKILPSKHVTAHSRKTKITVEYSVLGEIDSGLNISINKRTETYVFKLEKIHGQWKVWDPGAGIPPHISVETAIRHTESWGPIEGEDHLRYLDMLEKLKKLQESQDAQHNKALTSSL